MSNKDVIAKLNENRQKLLIRNPHPKVNILATIRVAKEGSEEFKEKVAIIECGEKFFFKEYPNK